MKKQLKKLWLKLFPEKKLPIDEQLVVFLKATWCQKQLDDLHLVNQSVQMSLKRSPFDKKAIDMRNRVHHDIAAIQPIVLETGLKAAAIIEKDFGVKFQLLSVRERGQKQEAPPPEQVATKSGIILPGQEKN